MTLWLSDPPTAPFPKLGATVEKFRRRASGGLKAMEREEVLAYAAAVSRAILSLQRSELARETPTSRPNCASGTAHTDGKSIAAAMRAKQRAKLAACPAQERRARSPGTWHSMYADAMTEKRAFDRMLANTVERNAT